MIDSPENTDPIHESSDSEIYNLVATDGSNSQNHNESDNGFEDGRQPQIVDREITSLENSFVILSSDNKPHDFQARMDINEASSMSHQIDEENALTNSQRSDNSIATTSATNDSHRSSAQGGPRKSESFMSRLNDSHTKVDPPPQRQKSNSSNLPSTFASALSSISSFTSNFTLNGLQNDNNISSNHNISRTNPVNLTIETASASSRSSQNIDSKDEIFLRKATLERSNLINLTKLIVRDLISSSLASGRTIENECQSAIHLSNYFTLVDRVLKHGLKQNLLSNRSTSLWSALDNLPKYLKESTLMSESIRSLAHTKTPDGRIKAWIRLAMMQKKLPEYFNELLAQKDMLLKDIYYEFAFMLNDESHVFAGLIIGVNVIDCNFFVKDDNFDMMDDIIDLSPYLRPVNSFDDETEKGDTGLHDADFSEQKCEPTTNLAKILDQKNYLEEWNKHLESTISNLRAKLRNIEEQNSRLEMEAKVSEVRIAKLQDKRGDTSLNNSLNDNYIASKVATSSGSLPIPDAIKSMMSRNRSSTNVPENNKYLSNISVENTVLAKSKDAETDSQEAQNELITRSNADEIPENKENSKVSSTDVTDKAVQDPSSGDQIFDQPDADLILELEIMKEKSLKQEEELISLRERISILETSYRGALDRIRILERDLDIQTSMNSDKETTIKIYEKDIREKQQQVESLRASLTDAKKLNSDLSERLTDTSAKLKDRLKSVTLLQTSLDKWKIENKTLATRLQDKQTAFASLSTELEKSMEQIKELKKYNERINDDLRKERECGQTSSVTVEEQNVKITELSENLANFEKKLNDLGPYRDQYETLKKRCQEYELSLEEVGSQLRESRLEVENLKENSSVFLDSQWMDSKQVRECALCQQSFSVTRRKHHCRLCGNVFCQTCSDNKMELASSAKPARVCDTCHAFLLAKFVKSANLTQQPIS